MNHISIRRIQSILLKVALVLGASVSGGVGFCDLLEPEANNSARGWRVKVDPSNHPYNKINIDALIGAEGTRVTVPGFTRKEFRGKLAIAITANFVNNRTTAEAVVEEISGIAFVYKQDFFNSLYEELGIALENIVYYKDETHYFVMTTIKHSLLDRKVLKKDLKDPVELLSQKNINKKKLLEYIRDTCDYCTDYQLPELEIALNHHGEPDVALFDFTSMFAASNSAYVKEKDGRQLLLSLVGDGLLEPFWPTGSGIARGFLGCLDVCNMMSEWCSGHKSVLDILAERESVYRLLAQTTPENVSKDFRNYTFSPTTRYPNLNKFLYSGHQMTNLYISDQLERGDVPRRQYTPSCGQFQSPVSKPKYQLHTQTKQQRQRSDSLDYASDSSDSPPPMDLKSRMRALMEAANGGNNNTTQNDADKYVSNRAKLREQREEQAKQVGDKSVSKQKNPAGKGITRPNFASKDEKVDMNAAKEKISQTFGYGEPKIGVPKASPPPLLSAKERQAERKQQSQRPSKTVKQNTAPEIQRAPVKKKSNSNTKAKSSKVDNSDKRKGQVDVEKWDFTSNPSKTRVARNEIDRAIDPELDLMLAQLEMDDDFKKLDDNAQLTWLESLFYLDTPSKQASSGLVKPKPREELPKRKKSALSLYSKNKEDQSSNDSKEEGISAKTFSVQNRRERNANSFSNDKKSPAPKSIQQPVQVPLDEEKKSLSSSREAGVNKDLCSLAQAFFDTDKSKRPPPQRRISATSMVNSQHDTPSPSSSLSSWTTNSTQEKHDRRSYPLAPERAYFQPTNSAEVEEDDDNICIPSLPNTQRKNNFSGSDTSAATTSQKRNVHLKTPSQIYKERSPSSQEDAPPIPERSAQPKMMMLKLMKNATNALKNN